MFLCLTATWFSGRGADTSAAPAHGSGRGPVSRDTEPVVDDIAMT